VSKFYGTFDSGLDSKRRVSIPAQFRNRIDSDPESGREKTIALFASPEPAYPTVFGCTFSLLEGLPFVQTVLAEENSSARKIASRIMRTILEHKIDNTGRIVLHQKLVTAADLGGKIFFHGQGDFFEIWPMENIENHYDEDDASLTRLVFMRMIAEAKAASSAAQVRVVE
jgi:DNA-binding transcriptional regulator/RsmH inhibitor MraZ